MKRRNCIVLLSTVFAVFILALSACSSGDQSASNSEDNSSNAQGTEAPTGGFELVVGFDSEFPPYGFVGDDGQYTGFDLDLAKAVCDKRGWVFRNEAIDWDAKDAMLNAGSINCIWNGFTVEGREDNYAFSAPYMINQQVIVTKADSNISSLDDLAGKTVITQRDSAALEVLSNKEQKKDLADTFENLQTIGDYNNAFIQLDSGMVDAVACDSSIFLYQDSLNSSKFKQLDEPLSSEHYAVGCKKGNTGLAEVITETLKELDDEGVVEELCQKYAEYGMSYSNWTL